MGRKAIILIEDNLFKLEDMLLSIQSILFVAAKKGLYNAPYGKDTTIYVLHIISESEEEDITTFKRFETTLKNREIDLMKPNYNCELNYRYVAAKINKETYPPANWKTVLPDICKEISKMKRQCDYAIILDVVLNEEKDKGLVLDNKEILSHALFKKYKEHCIPYTKYEDAGQRFRENWKAQAKTGQLYERFCLDGNVIHKNFKEDIYKQLNIEIEG